MNREQIKSKFENLTIWTYRDTRAPHKPLLVLYALGRLQRDGARWLSYEEVKENLAELLAEFGPPRPPRTNFPFVRLANDGVWELSKPLDTKRDHSDSELLANGVTGGFVQEVYDALVKDPSLVGELAQSLLDQHFPETMHGDILAAVGLDLSQARPAEQASAKAQRARRDPEFRERVLRAYEYRCAVCGFNVRLGHMLVALDAAHIKWWQAGGPDVEANGLALCSMHHKLFDRGVFTIASTNNSEFMVRVSEEAHGTIGFREWVLEYHGKPIRSPQRPEYFPAQDFMEWHAREVFRGRPRYLARSSVGSGGIARD
ncbi:MAG: phosphorothioated DNA-binding restriction endonuclease [Clostridia bacterium]